MKQVYIDTNIFDYVVLHDTKYGSACKKILDDIGTKFSGICSMQVPVEIIGSIAAADKSIVADALTDFMSLDLKLIPVSNEILSEAARLVSKEKLDGYDSIHVATMKTNGIDTIITENYEDFKNVKWLNIVRPLDYHNGL